MTEPGKMESSVSRRRFLQDAAAGTSALIPMALTSDAQQSAQPVAPDGPAGGAAAPAAAEALTTDRPGSDFMVDVIKSLDIEYCCANPGTSFRSLHESIVNYGGNAKPEFLTCLHEESSVAMAHGYAKIAGKPLLVCAHGTVGVQHASMAIYNAFCDRVPVIVFLGNTVDATQRAPGVEWTHCVQDAASMVRDFVKWDDLPGSLTHFAESAVRAYKIAMTPPMMPVVLVVDSELQEQPPEGHETLRVPKLTLASPPQGESAAVAEAARWLVQAANPVILADRAARTPAGVARLVELAEVLQAPVIDTGGRMNFPNRHALSGRENRAALIAEADVILGLEMADFWGAVHAYRDQLHRSSRSITKPDARLVSITSGDLFIKANYQDFQRFPDVDLAIAGDAEATLPSLIEAVKRLTTGDRQRVFEARGAKLAAAHSLGLQRARDAAAYAWDASPISTARLSAELWDQLRNEDWSLVSATTFVSAWPQRLWDFTKHHQYIGVAGGYGIGYGAPAAVGAALANRKQGRVSVAIQTDGDLMYAPGILWTAAHHKIPLLSVMHNNRAYHQEVMQVQIMAARHNRGITQSKVGTAIDEPAIDYARLAQSMGVHGEGPISDPRELGPAIKRALAVVKRGEPALIDVLTQPR